MDNYVNNFECRIKNVLDLAPPGSFISATLTPSGSILNNPVAGGIFSGRMSPILDGSAIVGTFFNDGAASLYNPRTVNNGAIRGLGLINSGNFAAPHLSSMQDLVTTNKNSILSPWQVVTTDYYLVDAGTSHRELAGIRSHTFTTAGVIRENTGWAKCLNNNQVLTSYTKEDFINNGGSITLTAFDNGGTESRVNYSTTSDIVICDHCKGGTSVSLTSCNITTHVCNRILNTTDFGLLVRNVAFPETFTLITNDSCLGWSAMNLNSFAIDNKIFWKEHYQKFYIKKLVKLIKQKIHVQYQ